MGPHLELTLRLTEPVPCANLCSFCPQDKLGEAYKATVRAFTLDSLKFLLRSVPLSIQIHFSGYTEPFFHRQAADMIYWVFCQGWRIHLFTTLMGLREREGLVRDYFERVVIHVPDEKAFVVDDERWMRQHDIWMKVGFNAEYMSMGTLTSRVQVYLETVGVPDVRTPTMQSRAANNWAMPVLEGPLRCKDDRWHANVLMPNGDVQLCCMDYGLKATLGNLMVDTYEQIWNTSESWRKNANPPQDSICRVCEHGVPA